MLKLCTTCQKLGHYHQQCSSKGDRVPRPPPPPAEAQSRQTTPPIEDSRQVSNATPLSVGCLARQGQTLINLPSMHDQTTNLITLVRRCPNQPDNGTTKAGRAVAASSTSSISQSIVDSTLNVVAESETVTTETFSAKKLARWPLLMILCHAPRRNTLHKPRGRGSHLEGMYQPTWHH